MSTLVNNKAHCRQLIVFDGMRFNSISPTDIDAFLDFGGDLFVIIEVKLDGSSLPTGQHLALERLCDSCQRGGVDCWLLVAKHSSISNGDIDLASCVVSDVRHNEEWKKPKSTISVRLAVDKIRESRKVSQDNDSFPYCD